MARYRKRDAVEARLADALEVEGRTFTADLIAKRFTGVEGYRVTLAFLERDGSGSFFVQAEPAASREEVGRRVEALRADEEELRALLRDRLAAGGGED